MAFSSFLAQRRKEEEEERYEGEESAWLNA